MTRDGKQIWKAGGEHYFSHPVQATVKEVMLEMGLDSIYKLNGTIFQSIVDTATERLSEAPTELLEPFFKVDRETVFKIANYWRNPIKG